jgi:lysozyme
VRFETLKAVGARFVYLPLSSGPGADGPGGFAERFAAARAAGLKVGVVLPFDPCLGADAQSGLFAQMVPRDTGLLPPAIALDSLADTCEPAVSDAAVESELMTLINQIELHAGRPAILRLSRAFEARHHTATALARDLWLMRDRARPDYAGRPWLLWSANSARVTEASEEPVEWVVVQK